MKFTKKQFVACVLIGVVGGVVGLGVIYTVPAALIVTGIMAYKGV